MAEKIVRARRTYDVDCIVTLAGSDDVFPMLLRRCKMQVRELGDGSAYLVIESPLRDFPTVEVDEWDAKHRRRKCRG